VPGQCDETWRDSVGPGEVVQFSSGSCRGGETGCFLRHIFHTVGGGRGGGVSHACIHKESNVFVLSVIFDVSVTKYYKEMHVC
jgi:hypothetical protein